MQVVIEEVVSRIRAKGEDSLSAETLHTIVGAVKEAIEAENRRSRQISEEMSLGNHMGRPGQGG